jgi:arylsulfatase
MRALGLLIRNLVFCTLVIAGTGCRQPVTVVADGSPPQNVIIILVDTLRADHMSLYGYPRPTTPFIDRLAEESVVFERARSQAACTFPSVNSVLTSRYPFDFYRMGEGEMGIPAEYSTIAEILRGDGYRTIAVSSSPIVRATPSKENPSGGFGRGFDVFDEHCLWNNARCVNARALKALEGVEEPFFLYLHYMDPHGHYSPPETYEKVFAGPYDGYDFIAAGDHNPIAAMLFSDGPQLDIGERDIQHLVDLYDDEIRYCDQQLQLLMERLQRDGLLDRSLLVVTSDHGEEFMEHGQVGHCRGVWDTLTRVPLIIRSPDITGGVRIESAVQLVDIVPTICDELGLSLRGLEVEGIPLGGLMRGSPPERTYAFTDQSRFRAADDGHWQLILDGLASTATLFDVRNDPLAQNNLFAAGGPDLDRLGATLNRWLDETGQAVDFDAALAASKAKEEELRALGYLQ